MRIGRRKRIFLAITILLLLQVAWWGVLFVHTVDEMAGLSMENLRLQGHAPGLHSTVTAEKIEHLSQRRKWMFLSESAFFALLTCLGIWGLYRAISREEKAQEIQKNFINIVSHETKTPLTALKLRLEALRDEHPSVDINLALEEVRRLTSTFDKTMSLNRLERGVFDFEEIALSDLIQRLLQRLEPFFQVKNAVVHWEGKAKGWVKADSYSLTNSIQNLLENAVLYNPNPQKELSIQLVEEGDQVKLQIQDNGAGISEKESGAIFEKFFRGATSRGTAGTGLGLYLSKLVVEAHGGSIRLLRAAKGATFEILLPKVVST